MVWDLAVRWPFSESISGMEFQEETILANTGFMEVTLCCFIHFKALTPGRTVG